jgi:isocitrate lyase
MLRTVSRSVARQSRTLRISSRTPQLLRPLSTTAYRMSSSALNAIDPPVSAVLPGDSFQLLPEASKAGEAEDALFEEQVQAVNDWWASPRYKGIKRPYSAEDVVSKRGALQQSYPSSLMARKLFNLLEEKAAKGEPVHTSAFNLVPIARTMTDHVTLNFSGCN